MLGNTYLDFFFNFSTFEPFILFCFKLVAKERDLLLNTASHQPLSVCEVEVSIALYLTQFSGYNRFKPSDSGIPVYRGISDILTTGR